MMFQVRFIITFIGYLVMISLTTDSFHMRMQLDNPVIIFPGFGNDIVDYINPLNKGEENGFVSQLKSRGINVSVVPIKRLDWLQVALGIADKKYWSYECIPDELFKFYYTKAYEEIYNVKEKYGKPPIILGHSAGGWLARGMISDGLWKGNVTPTSSVSSVSSSSPSTIRSSENVSTDRKKSDTAIQSKDMVAGLVTLGTPHLPPLDKKYDSTRGSLQYINDNYPGAFLRNQGLFYMSVASEAIVSDKTASFQSIEYFAHQSYKQVVGKNTDIDNLTGDGVVPFGSSHLDGAKQITFSDVYHSISAPDFKWYGGKDVVDRWLPEVVKLNKENNAKRKIKNIFR